MDVLPFTVVGAALASLAGFGAAIFYGGKDTSKSVGHFLGLAGVTTLVWALVAYSVAFSFKGLPTYVIGDDSVATINKANYLYQGAVIVAELQFVLLTVALIAGGVAGRFSAKWFFVIMGVWVIAVYAPQTFWQVNRLGWAYQYGIIDYAGGLTVHVAAGVAALVLGLLAGKGKAADALEGVPSLASLAALIVGCFFLNAGRVVTWSIELLAAGNLPTTSITQQASLALLNTQMAAAAGVVSYGVLEIVLSKGLFKGEATLKGAATGALVGLAATASGAAYILPMWTVLIAFVAVAFVFVAQRLTAKVSIPGFAIFLIHGLGGAVGVACTGLFAQTSLGAPANGSFMYNAIQLGKQCAGISYIILMTGVATAVIYGVQAALCRYVLQSPLLVKEEEAAAPVEGAKAVVA